MTTAKLEPLPWYEGRADGIDEDASALEKCYAFGRIIDTLRDSARHIRTLVAEVKRLREENARLRAEAADAKWSVMRGRKCRKSHT